MIHILISLTASLRPCQKVCCLLLTQSSSPISSSRRHTASCFSSSLSQPVVLGKLGNTKMATKAITTVIHPSMMNSHLHALRPNVPSMFFVIPAAIRPEKAPEMSDPEYSIAVLNPSSFRVYHELKKYRQPGKYAASMKPRKNRTVIKPPKEWTAAVAAEMTPQMIMAVGR